METAPAKQVLVVGISSAELSIYRLYPKPEETREK